MIDALIALSILTVLSSSVLPLYSHLYEERSAIKIRTDAVMLLKQYWTSLLLEEVIPPNERVYEEDTYHIFQKPDQLCISFSRSSTKRALLCRSLPNEK
ncbi:MAG: hypothetical protein WBV93_11175 [Anaerobacillus sp.]